MHHLCHLLHSRALGLFENWHRPYRANPPFLLARTVILLIQAESHPLSRLKRTSRSDGKAIPKRWNRIVPPWKRPLHPDNPHKFGHQIQHPQMTLLGTRKLYQLRLIVLLPSQVDLLQRKGLLQRDYWTMPMKVLVSFHHFSQFAGNHELREYALSLLIIRNRRFLLDKPRYVKRLDAMISIVMSHQMRRHQSAGSHLEGPREFGPSIRTGAF